MSGYQDSNLGPPAPKAGALTGLRYTPLYFLSVAKIPQKLIRANFSREKFYVSNIFISSSGVLISIHKGAEKYNELILTP